MKRLSSLFLLFILVVSPLAVFAQDGGDMATYTSDDGLLTVQYPAEGWVAQPLQEDLPFPAVAILKEDSVDRFMNDEDIQSGDAAVIVIIFPADLVSMMTMGDEDSPQLSAEPTPTELATFFQYFFTEQEEEGDGILMEGTAEPDMAEAEATAEPEGDVEEVDLTDELTAGYAPLSDDTGDGGIFAYQIGDGLYAVTYAIAYPGEFTDELKQLTQDVAASLTYTGTAEDLMSGMQIPMGTEEPGGDTSATLDGDTLVSERCTVCHSRDRIDAKDEDEAGWTAIVDRMISYGAQLNAEERDAVIQYLVDTH
jgi:hypothetical protein